MTFAIITHVPHSTSQKQYFAYAPYVREMNLWLKNVDKTIIVAPKTGKKPSNIDLAYLDKNIQFSEIPVIQFTSLKNSFSSVIKLPVIVWTIYRAFKRADHIHLRCPGNIGLLGCFVQILFPKKLKTAKYAGNWDPKAKQPFSYKLQKWILSHTFLTRNMQVLVYGNWENQTKNIKPFFTATYDNSEIETAIGRDYSKQLKCVFLGSLVSGKRPLFAIKMVETLVKNGIDMCLDVYGDGYLKESLQRYILENNLENFVKIYGNKPKDTVKASLKRAHFIILPSKSEGWPKALAEGMFFGVIPIATTISCVPNMLDFGKRGILIDTDLGDAVIKVMNALKQPETLVNMSQNAAKWSQNYTLDVFENEISKLINPT